MKKIFLVKKDVNKPNGQDNWIIMNGYEFSRFMETEEGQRRKKNFATLEDCENHDNDNVIECGEFEAKRIEMKRHRALRKKQAQYNVKTLSLDHPSFLHDESTFEESLADESADVERIFFEKIRKELLFEAIKTLTQLQQELIWEVFLSEKQISLSEYAAKNKIYCSAACERKRRAFNNLKKYLEKHGITSEQFD